MMVIMNVDATKEQIDAVVARVEANKFRVTVNAGDERTLIAVIGSNPSVLREQIMYMPGVDHTVPISRPYKVASREFIPENTVFPLDGFVIGGDEVIMIAGPCAVESRTQMLETAQAVKEAGAHALRGGAFKPRTSPYSLQGMGEERVGDFGRGARADRSAGGDRSDDAGKGESGS